MATLGKRVAVPIVPGVMPLEDSTELDTLYFTNSDKIRFQNSKLRKIKGWQRIFSTNFQRITGAARNIFSYTDQSGMPLTVIGTNTRLYAVIESTFYNITPLETATTTIASAFSTEFVTNTFEVTTTAGSAVVTLNIFQYLNTNDLIQIAGASGPINGIPASAFDGTFLANVINDTQIQINVGSVATSSGTQALTFQWATSYLYVTYPNHGLLKGDRIGLLAATGVANIPDTQINGETLVTNVVNPNTFVIQTGTIATSLVTGGGGASTTIQVQIAAGNVDQSDGFGYGGGNYGIGNYGVQGQFGHVGTFPRIWSMDVYGANLVLTPGDPLTSSTDNLYAWANDVTVAPVLVSSLGGAANVPLAVRWVYVSHNAVVTLGAAGITNNYVASGTENIEDWTQDASTNAFSLIIQQAGPFISQATSRNRDCIFTENEVYLVEFVDKPFIWNFRKLFTTDGLIGPKARSEVEDAIFWMGQGDFFVFDGTSVNIIPNNTIKRYVFDNINFSQGHKVVAFADVEYNEVWWFYPIDGDMEPNNYVKYNYKDGIWDLGTLNRSAAEEPLTIHELPYLIQSVIPNTLTIGNNVRTYFFSPANDQIGPDPLTTTSGSQLIAINVVADCYLQVGDYIYVSNALDTNGIPASEINGVKQIVSLTYEDVDVSGESLYGVGLYGVGLYSFVAGSGIGTGYGEGGYGLGGYGGSTATFGYGSGLYGVGLYGVSQEPDNQEIQLVISSTSTTASSSGSGGGDTITIGTNIIGLDFQDTVGIGVNEIITVSGVQDVDGIPGSQINGESIPVRFVDGNTVQIADQSPMTVFSTSLAVGGGPFAAVDYIRSDRLFMHEYGNDDYNPNYVPDVSPPEDQFAAMNAYAITNYAQIDDGDQVMVVYTVYPDSNQQGAMELTVNGRLYAQYPTITKGPYQIDPTTPKIDIMMVARERQYMIQSNVLGGTFVVGKWQEEVKPSSTR